MSARGNKSTMSTKEKLIPAAFGNALRASLQAKIKQDLRIDILTKEIMNKGK